MAKVGAAYFGSPKEQEFRAVGLLQNEKLWMHLYGSTLLGGATLTHGEHAVVLMQLDGEYSGVSMLVSVHHANSHPNEHQRPGGFVGSAICFDGLPTAKLGEELRKMDEQAMQLIDSSNRQFKYPPGQEANWSCNPSGVNFNGISVPLVKGGVNASIGNQVITVGVLGNPLLSSVALAQYFLSNPTYNRSKLLILYDETRQSRYAEFKDAKNLSLFQLQDMSGYRNRELSQINEEITKEKQRLSGVMSTRDAAIRDKAEAIQKKERLEEEIRTLEDQKKDLAKGVGKIQSNQQQQNPIQKDSSANPPANNRDDEESTKKIVASGNEPVGVVDKGARQPGEITKEVWASTGKSANQGGGRNPGPPNQTGHKVTGKGHSGYSRDDEEPRYSVKQYLLMAAIFLFFLSLFAGILYTLDWGLNGGKLFSNKGSNEVRDSVVYSDEQSDNLDKKDGAEPVAEQPVKVENEIEIISFADWLDLNEAKKEKKQKELKDQLGGDSSPELIAQIRSKNAGLVLLACEFDEQGIPFEILKDSFSLHFDRFEHLYQFSSNSFLLNLGDNEIEWKEVDFKTQKRFDILKKYLDDPANVYRAAEVNVEELTSSNDYKRLIDHFRFMVYAKNKDDYDEGLDLKVVVGKEKFHVPFVIAE